MCVPFPEIITRKPSFMKLMMLCQRNVLGVFVLDLILFIRILEINAFCKAGVLLFFETVSHILGWLSRGWPWTSYPLATNSQILGLQVCIAILSLCSVEVNPRASRMLGETSYQLSYIPSPCKCSLSQVWMGSPGWRLEFAVIQP